MTSRLSRGGTSILERATAVALPLSLSRRLVIDASNRLFTLEQRNSLKGHHIRQHVRTAGRRYAAGVAVPESLAGAQATKPAVYPQAVTAAIAEIEGGAIRIIEHVRWQRPQASLAKVLDTLGTGWACHVVMVSGPISSASVPCWRVRRGSQDALVGDGLLRLDLGRDLLETMNRNGVHVYAEDASSESTGFWSQVIRARRIGQGDEFRVYVEPKGDDGYLVSLALAIEAAALLLEGQRAPLCAAAAWH